MAVRPIDANAMLAELKPITREMEHASVLISDLAVIMRNWVERQPTLPQPSVERIVDTQPTLPQPSNEPLTLEELQEMDGKPAFAPETNCWILVTKNSFVPLFTFPDGVKCSVYDWYEHVGPVYRRPPEGEIDGTK